MNHRESSIVKLQIREYGAPCRINTERESKLTMSARHAREGARWISEMSLITTTVTEMIAAARHRHRHGQHREKNVCSHTHMRFTHRECKMTVTDDRKPRIVTRVRPWNGSVSVAKTERLRETSIGSSELREYTSCACATRCYRVIFSATKPRSISCPERSVEFRRGNREKKRDER